jgi:hypothetical protein
MTPRRLLGFLLGAFVGVAAMDCGDVPTLPEGIAFISSVITPAPAVVSGDTLRDTTGRVVPLHVYSFGRNGDTLADTAERYLITSLDTGVRIGRDGILVATDTGTRTIRLVGQLGDRLQTPELSLPIVRQPDSIRQSFVYDTIGSPTPQDFHSKPLTVTVTGMYNGSAVAVQGVIVNYAISQIFPAGALDGFPDSVVALVDDSDQRLAGRGGRFAVDTTDPSGIASRRIRQVLGFPGFGGFDSLFVTVRAKSFRGDSLKGSGLIVFKIRGGR